MGNKKGRLEEDEAVGRPNRWLGVALCVFEAMGWLPTTLEVIDDSCETTTEVTQGVANVVSC